MTDRGGDTDDAESVGDGGSDGPDYGPTVEVRRGREGDLLDALRILEGAMLTVGANQVRRRTESGGVLVATVDGRIVGALVRDAEHVEAVAVHPDRRGSGIGRRLVEAALAETGRLTAEFRAEVRPFYETLGFSVEEEVDGTDVARADEAEGSDRGDGEPRLWGECERGDERES